MSEAKVIEFKPEIIDIKNDVRKLLTVSADGVIGLDQDAKDLSSLLPEGQSLQSHLEHQKSMDLIGHGLLLAGTELAVEAMKKNKDLQKVSYEIPSFGKNHFTAVFERNGMQRGAPGTTDVTPFVGNLSLAKHEVVSTRTKAEYKSIKEQFKALAAAADL